MSCFARGIMLITVVLLQGRCLPTGQFVPFTWPTSPGEGGVEASSRTGEEKPYP